MTTPSTAQLACKTMPLDPSHSLTPCMPTCIKQPARPFPSFWACVTFEPPHAEPSLHLHVNHAKPTCFSLPTCSCPFHPQTPYLLTLLHQAIPSSIPLVIPSLQPHLPLHPHTLAVPSPIPLAIPSLPHHLPFTMNESHPHLWLEGGTLKERRRRTISAL